jgi:predicted Zn finger-like uncharacterized protein
MMPAMSLATRCTACGTIFRVVQDQLRVSEGWVRCGRCAEVFDAREQLFDLDRETPPPWPAAGAEPAAAREEEATVAIETSVYDEPPAARPPAMASAPSYPPDEEKTWSLPPVDQAQEDAREDVRHEAPAAARGAAPDFVASSLPDQGSRREPYWDDEPAPSPALAPPASPPAAVATAAATAAPEEDPAPVAPATEAAAPPPQVSFLRQADPRQGRRQGLLLGGGALLLTLTLLLQLTWQFRHALQAVLPQSAPLLQAFCGLAGCSLEPWKRIDALEVENSGLTQAGSGNHYKLSVQLRNKAGYPVALPWVDLSLTDGSGAQVLRRMLKPTDFNLAQGSIAGHGEQVLQLVFSTGKLKISSYQVVIFHP